MPASLPTVSNSTLAGWLFIFRLMGCGLSGRNTGTGNIESIFSRLSRFASCDGVRLRLSESAPFFFSRSIICMVVLISCSAMLEDGSMP